MRFAAYLALCVAAGAAYANESPELAFVAWLIGIALWNGGDPPPSHPVIV